MVGPVGAGGTTSLTLFISPVTRSGSSIVWICVWRVDADAFGVDVDAFGVDADAFGRDADAFGVHADALGIPVPTFGVGALLGFDLSAAFAAFFPMAAQKTLPQAQLCGTCYN